MNNQIIEAVDYLGEKIGLAIDWTAENVYSQLVDFMSRYKVYSIIEDAIWMLIGICIVFAFVWFIKKYLIPDHNLARENKTDTNFHEYYKYITPNVQLNVEGGLIMIFGGIAFVVALTVTILEARDIIRWTFIPEYQFYNIILGLIK